MREASNFFAKARMANSLGRCEKVVEQERPRTGATSVRAMQPVRRMLAHAFRFKGIGMT